MIPPSLVPLRGTSLCQSALFNQWRAIACFSGCQFDQGTPLRKQKKFRKPLKCYMSRMCGDAIAGQIASIFSKFWDQFHSINYGRSFYVGRFTRLPLISLERTTPVAIQCLLRSRFVCLQKKIFALLCVKCTVHVQFLSTKFKRAFFTRILPQTAAFYSHQNRSYVQHVLGDGGKPWQLIRSRI